MKKPFDGRAPRPTVERLREVFDYDPDTGRLTWRVQLNPRGQIGQLVGFTFPNGRRTIQLDWYRCYAATAIWALVTGTWPEATVDHHDCDPSNDRWVNFRLATPSQQIRNTRRRNDNTSGEKGVWWHKGNKRWVVEVHADGRKHRKSFINFDDAVAARRALAVTLHGEFVRHG